MHKPWRYAFTPALRTLTFGEAQYHWHSARQGGYADPYLPPAVSTVDGAGSEYNLFAGIIEYFSRTDSSCGADECEIAEENACQNESGFLRVCQIVVALWFLISVSAAQTNRQVAITIDDLPAAASNFMSSGEITDMTSKLLTTLRDQKVPAVGFVNEKKVYKFGEIDGGIKALDFGFELGNHSYSHTSLNFAGLRTWEDDVIQGEPLLQLLLSAHNLRRLPT